MAHALRETPYSVSGRLSRRSLLGGGAAAAAAGLLVACSGSNNNKSSAPTTAPATRAAGGAAPASSTAAARASGTAAAAPAGGTAAASSGTAAAAPGAAVVPSSLRGPVPAPPSYSKAAPQKLLADYHWSKIGPDVQVLGTPRKGGVLALATASFGLQSLHPTEEPVGQWPFCYTHNNLAGMEFSYKVNDDLMPATANYSVSQSWEQPDATTLIFKLRPEVTWHNVAPANGEKLSVADVKATYDLFKASKYHGLNFKDVANVDEPNPGFARFTSSAPNMELLGALRNPSFAVLNAKHIQEGDDALKTKAIGTGPFTLAKFQPLTVRSYKRNPNYWVKDAAGNQLPYLDGAVQTVIADPAALVAAFRSGQIDYYRPVSPEEFTRLQKELDTWAQTCVGCGCQSFAIVPSMRDPLLKDVRVRRAMSLAVNRQDIVDTVFGGAATAHDWIPWYYRGRYFPETFDEMGQWYKYDPQQAKQLLQAAGWQSGTKVDLYFSGSILPGTGTTSGDPYIESIKRDFSAVGIELNLKPLGPGDTSYYGQQWNGLFSTASGSGVALDADNWVQYLVTGSGLNGAGVSDPMLDALFQKERSTVNVDDRAKVFNDIEQYANRDALLRGVQLPSGFGLSLWRKYLHNVIDTTSWWINGGAGQEMANVWQDDKAAKRNIDSY
jgi:ABC-type transport system substrate-binding protein